MIPALLGALAVDDVLRPNIVYIMADDLGYGELGCYGQEKIPTPHIDKLAQQGLKFDRFYVASPVCAPTRYSLLTGRHQGHATIRGNKERGAFDARGKEGQFPIPKKDRTIATALQQVGYTTGLVGKWGLGSPLPGETPMDHGFDSFYGYICQRRAHNHYPVYLWSNHDPDPLPGNTVFDAHQRIPSPLDTEDEYYKRFAGGTHSATAMANQAVDFIRKNKAKPFFLYYAPTLPHVSVQAPREWVDKFPKEWDDKPYLGQQGYLPHPRPRAGYAAMIAYLDHTVGLILDELDRNGLSANTLVVFTSDNGATNTGGMDREFFQSNGILRDGKMSVYEGGIRVPFVARWPGVIQPGTTTDEVAVCYDTATTLADITGAKMPRTDGKSFFQVLRGGTMPARDYIYVEYPEASAQQAVIFGGRYKVIRPDLKKNRTKVEVYDLVQDPSEKNDLAPQKPEWVRKGLAAMNREHRPNKDFPLGVIDNPKGE